MSNGDPKGAAIGGHIKEGRADVVANVTRQDTSGRRLSQLFYPYLYLYLFSSRVHWPIACTPAIQRRRFLEKSDRYSSMYVQRFNSSPRDGSLTFKLLSTVSQLQA